VTAKNEEQSLVPNTVGNALARTARRQLSALQPTVAAATTSCEIAKSNTIAAYIVSDIFLRKIRIGEREIMRA
jgi:hypothetical protein